MNFDSTSSYDYKGMCAELGIEYSSFLAFLNNQNPMKTVTLTDDDKPLSDAIDMFLANQKQLLKLKKISPNTQKLYEGVMKRLKTYIEGLDKKYTIASLDEVMFGEFLLDCRKEKNTILSDRTQNTYTAVLKRFLGYCYTMELSKRDHRSKFKFNTVGLMPRYLPDAQVKAFLSEAKQRRNGYLWHTIFSFLIGTGCRVSEVIKIRICDFDLENNVLRIYKSKGKKDRTIPLYPEVVRSVKRYLNLTGLQELHHNHTGYLFTHGYGMDRQKNLSIRSIERMVVNICKKLGFIERYTVHSFRHTFAVRCLMAGMKIEYLCQVMGHTDPKTTYIYLQMLPVDLQKEISEKYPFAFENLLLNIFNLEE
ncbi:integrase [Paenibacillus phyllosphaerae]|uniref:Integrase n=1 Tax=Paenibacillus phyllosphaerae TaxID=274593 RepID=A0A7W5AT50_9BACL|nr:site-specific integrase [Paenibacillus phyllosphaerae]MBB3108172.1 integrase [Paenibacillus phyllosphaerae]